MGKIQSFLMGKQVTYSRSLPNSVFVSTYFNSIPALLALIAGIAWGPPATQGQSADWARSGGGEMPDAAYAIAVDAYGNSHVSGTFEGNGAFGPHSLVGHGDFDLFVVKYDSGGNVLWVQSAGGVEGTVGSTGIGVDAVGNVYVTGVCAGTVYFGEVLLASTGSLDVFLAKYDSSGNLLWIKSAGGAGYDFCIDIAVDAIGSTVVTGYFSGATATFDTYTLTNTRPGEGDIFVANYDNQGNVLWVWSSGGTYHDSGQGVGIDSNGNSYLTGNFSGTVNFGTFSLNSNGSGREIYMAKFDAAGSVLWAKSAGGPNQDTGVGIAVDSAGNSYITGDFFESATFDNLVLTSAGLDDVFVAKYDTDGELLWVFSEGGQGSDRPRGIDVDGAGNCFVTGGFLDRASFGFSSFASAGSRDAFVAKYNTDGYFQWAQQAGGAGYDIGWDIAADTKGDCYVAGEFSSSISFGDILLESAGDTDVFVAKYSLPPLCAPGYFSGDGREPCIACPAGTFASDSGATTCEFCSDCDDQNECTYDVCDPANGCAHLPATDPCDDGNACTIGEFCANGMCSGGATANCDDGNPCTNDLCDIEFGCINEPNEYACDDGNSCTEDSCDPFGGCVNTPIGGCVIEIPAASTWGLIAFALSLLCGARMYYPKRTRTFNE